MAQLDPTKQAFIVTDFYSSYPVVFGDFFGENLVHQLCLLHLNKLIVGDFPENGTIEQELMKYLLLNILYNRDAEIEVLEGMAKEERMVKRPWKGCFLRMVESKRSNEKVIDHCDRKI